MKRNITKGKGKNMTILEYAEKFIGTPYIWGGDGTGKKGGGFDCSGFVLECLWAFGVYKGQDTTAQGLFDYFPSYDSRTKKGAHICYLAFFGKSEKHISHVAFYDPKSLCILEAGGGGSKCTKVSESTGFVRYRPLSHRSDLVEIKPIFTP